MKIYKGYQFRNAVEELIGKVGKHYGRNFDIIWSEGTRTAGISRNGQLYLANVRDDATMTHRDLIRWVGFGVHELLHSLYTDFDARGNTEFIDAIHNAVEDAWIEHKGINQAVTGNVGNLLTELIDIMTQEALAEVTDWANPGQYPYALAVYLRDHAKVKVPLAEGLEPIFAEARKRLNGCNNSYDTLAIANWVVQKLNKLPPPSNGGSKRGNGNEGGEGDQDGEDGEGNGDPFDGVGKAVSPGAGKFSTRNPEPKLNPGANSCGGTYDTGNIKSDVRFSSPWANLSATVPAKLRYEVKRLFDKSGVEDFQRNRRAGAINVHALPSHQFNDKLFKLRRSVDGIDTAVVIVIDASGSMFDDGCYVDGNPSRILYAIQTCAALLDTLSRAQVATAVTVFGDDSGVLKPFNTPTVKILNALRGLRSAGGTNDYIAVRHAHTMLLNRPESRKVCFVITDGEGDYDSTREQCLAAERLGVTTIGVGIELNVSQTYPQCIEINDVQDLATVSFNRIKLAA